MLINKSPQKENRSPEHRRRDKANKQLKVMQELFQIIHSNGISLPPHLQNDVWDKAVTQHIQLFDTNKQALEMHRLKVKLSDYQFQIKKIEEDFAEFRLLAKMEKDKSIKKLKEELEFQRNKNSQESRKWQKKFQERQKQFDHECVEYRSQIQQKIKGQKQKEIHNLRQKHNDYVAQVQRQKQELKNNFQNHLSHLRKQNQSQLNNIIQRHKLQIQEMNRSNIAALQQCEKVLQNKIVTIQCERKAEIKITEEMKKQTNKTTQKYLQQIGTIERQKNKLQEKADGLDMKFKILNKKYQDRGKEIENIKKEYEIEIKRLINQKQTDDERAAKLFEQQRLRIMKQQYAKMEKMESKLLKLEEVKQNLQNNYVHLLRLMENRFENRQSKKQDIQIIKQFEQQLQNKSKETSYIYQQLKLVQLQRDNNDKIYTKIFTASRDKKSVSHRADRDIQSLLKQSHTTDFRSLLKMSHK